MKSMKAKRPQDNNVEPNSATRVNKVKLLGGRKKKDRFIDLHLRFAAVCCNKKKRKNSGQKKEKKKDCQSCRDT